MKKLIFLTMLSVSIFIGCEDTDNVTGPGNDGIELDWIYGEDIYHDLYYTNDDQITIVDTTYNRYGIKEFYEALGYCSNTWFEDELVKCDKIELFIYGSQNSYFIYSYDILPDVMYSRDVILDYCVWKEK